MLFDIIFYERIFMDLVIKVEYGGLGDYLFFSHIPRIAKLGLQASSADNYGGGGAIR